MRRGVRGVSENSVCSVHSSMHRSPPDSEGSRGEEGGGDLIWRMLTRTKDRLEENMENITSSSKRKGEQKKGGVKWIQAHWKLLFQLYPIRLELRQTKSFNAIELPALF